MQSVHVVPFTFVLREVGQDAFKCFSASETAVQAAEQSNHWQLTSSQPSSLGKHILFFGFFSDLVILMFILEPILIDIFRDLEFLSITHDCFLMILMKIFIFRFTRRLNCGH